MDNRWLMIGLMGLAGFAGFGFGRLSARPPAVTLAQPPPAGADLSVVTGGPVPPSGFGVDPSGGSFHASTDLHVDTNVTQDLQGALQLTPDQLNNLDLN